MTVRLELMSSEQYEAWLPSAIEGYAQQTSDSGLMAIEPARESAVKQFASLLPDGVATPGHHLLLAYDGEQVIGDLWLRIHDEWSARRAFVFNVEVDESQRGRGYGRDHDGRRGLRSPARRRRHGAERLRAERRRAVPLRQARLSRDQREYAERAHMSVSAGPKLTILTVSGTLEDGPSQGQAPTSARTVHLIP